MTPIGYEEIALKVDVVEELRKQAREANMTISAHLDEIVKREEVRRIKEDDDKNYYLYIALRPFKGEIEHDIAILEDKKEELSEDEKRKLNTLYDELYNIEQAQKKFDERTQTATLLIQNRRLKAEIKKLNRRNSEKEDRQRGR